MDLFNKKKVKSLEWDLMATKARLETKESEYEQLQKKNLQFFKALAEVVRDKYVGMTINYAGAKYTITDFSCDGGVPVFHTKDGVINSKWDDIINGFEIVEKKTKTTKTTKKKS